MQTLSRSGDRRASCYAGGLAMTLAVAACVLLPRAAAAGDSAAALALSDGWPIAAGGSHTCAVTKAGVTKCWGNNTDGQLGDGTAPTDQYRAVRVKPIAGDIPTVAAGASHTCAVTKAGRAKCWGYNVAGQLGDGTTTGRPVPVNVKGLTSGVADVAAGFAHTCAVTAAGKLKCWGSNNHGQLGDGTTRDRHAPTQVKRLSSGVAGVSAGQFFSCAMITAGGVKCWGYNNYGQLGDGTKTSRSAPVDVQGLTSDVAAVSAGYIHACALTEAGEVKCWGNNFYGQLGDGTTTDHRTPVTIITHIVAIAAGLDHTCALTEAGGIKCWGYNGFGQLGDGTTTDRHSPVDVTGLTKVVALAVGASHTCALTKSGNAKCWGYDDHGQLGNGTPGTDEHSPSKVMGF